VFCDAPAEAVIPAVTATVTEAVSEQPRLLFVIVTIYVVVTAGEAAGFCDDDENPEGTDPHE
jgi:hypothetical protein